jgi:catechol 2,3-dioxygenase-like lactoylglutathione lyase family enzyme
LRASGGHDWLPAQPMSPVPRRIDIPHQAWSLAGMLAMSGRARHSTGRTTMGFAVQHVHLKTRDPRQTVQFYIDNFGATLKADIPGRGFQLDLHGLQLNITTLIASQNHEQHYGIEHIAVETDDYQGTLDQLRKNGVRVLEELPPNNGKHVCFVECPDGAQMEIIERM